MAGWAINSTKLGVTISKCAGSQQFVVPTSCAYLINVHI